MSRSHQAPPFLGDNQALPVPRDRMIELLDDADNMKHWQKGLVNYAFLKGEPGQLGSTMQLEYKMLDVVSR